MEQLNGTFLFNSMYAEDMEGSKLSNLPGVGELLETYPSRSRPSHRDWAWESRGSPFPLWAPGRCTQGGEDQVRTHGVSGQQGPGCWGWSLAVHGFLLCASYPVFTTVSPPTGWVLSRTLACSWGGQACRGRHVARLGTAGWA